MPDDHERIAEERLLVADLREEVEGWRRRNLIVDSQIEAIREVTGCLRGIAETLLVLLSPILDVTRLGVDIEKLNVAILKEAAKKRTTKAGEEGCPENQNQGSSHSSTLGQFVKSSH